MRITVILLKLLFCTTVYYRASAFGRLKSPPRLASKVVKNICAGVVVASSFLLTPPMIEITSAATFSPPQRKTQPDFPEPEVNRRALFTIEFPSAPGR
jgi:hypothetical protein